MPMYSYRLMDDSIKQHSL